MSRAKKAIEFQLATATTPAMTTGKDEKEQKHLSTQEFGQQLNDGATLVQEQLAGLELQADALHSLEYLAATFNLPGTELERLTAQARELTESLEGIGQFLGNLDGFFARVNDAGVWQQVATLLLQFGDAHLYEEYMRSGGDIEGLIAAWTSSANGSGGR